MLAVRLSSMHLLAPHQRQPRSRCAAVALLSGMRVLDSPTPPRTSSSTTPSTTTTTAHARAPDHEHDAAARSRQADGHDRRQELHRAVHPRRALRRGAQGPGLQHRAQPQHRPDRGHDPGARERPARDVPGVPADLGPGDRRRAAERSARRAAPTASASATPLDHGLELLDADPVQRHRRDRGDRAPTPPSTISARSRICAGSPRR